MEIPKIEEFMIFEDDDEAIGIIIKCGDSWWKCYRNNECGQIFRETNDDKHYQNIKRLYRIKEHKRNDYSKFIALKFMRGENRFDDYECIYDKTRKEEPVIKNYTINISVRGDTDPEEIVNLFNKQLRYQLNI